MASVLNAKKRKCDVTTNGPIAELGFINGPVYNCRLTSPQIINLVTNGKRVYEIDPTNPNNKVLLTVTTCSESVFAPVAKPEVVEPVVELPKSVVEPKVVNSTVESNAHAELLAKLGYTEEKWRGLSKSEKRRLKAQAEGHNPQAQNVNEQTKKEESIAVEPSTPEVENKVDERETTPDPQITVDEPLKDSPTEEAVVAADM